MSREGKGGHTAYRGDGSRFWQPDKRIEEHREGYTYEALNDENKKKFVKMPILRAQAFAFKMCS